MELRCLRFGAIRNNVDLHDSVLDVWGDEDGCVEAAGIVLERLPAAVVVDGGPGGDRPAVIELPEKRTHGFGPIAAEMLSTDLDAFGLKHLTEIDEAGEVF